MFLLAIFISFSVLYAQESKKSPADILWLDACAMLDNRQYQEARNKFEEFTRRHLSDKRVQEARVRMGICDYRMGGRTSRALDAWNRVVNIEILQKRASPALLLGLEQLAVHYRTQGNIPEQSKILNHLLNKFQDETVTVREHTLAARERMEAGDYASAARLYGKVSAQLKGDDLLNYEVSKELSSPESSVTAILISADMHLASDNVPMAIRLYEEALRRNPDINQKHEAMTKLGWCLYVKGEWQKSEKLWRRVIKEGQAGSEWIARSRWHMIQLLAGPADQMNRALELCEIQIHEFPNHPEGERAMFTRAWLLWTRKDWAKARSAFEVLITTYPHTATAPPIRRYIADCEEGLSR